MSQWVKTLRGRALKDGATELAIVVQDEGRWYFRVQIAGLDLKGFRDSELAAERAVEIALTDMCKLLTSVCGGLRVENK